MPSRPNLRQSSKERIGFVIFASLVISLIWLTHSGASNSARTVSESPRFQNKKQPPQCPSCPPPSSRRIYAPAIDLNEAQRCEIVLNSRSANPIDITPTFYTASGDAVVGNPIQLQPAEIRFVPVEQLMPESIRGTHRWGGIALSYTGHVLEVWAQITFHGIGGGSIDETFNILEEPGSDTREAVWLMPRKGTAIIALGNTSSLPIHTTVQFSSGNNEDLEIPAGVTKFIRRKSHGRDDDAPESVKLTTVGPDGALRVAGFIDGDDDTFASSIRFYDTKKTVQSNLYAVNLRLKNAKPQIVLENTSDTEISIQPRFSPLTGDPSSSVDLPSMTIGARQTVELDLSALGEATASRTDLDSVYVQILSSAAPGSLIGAAYSEQRATGLIYDVPLRDSGKVRNATGSYPWRVDNDYSTIVVLTNVGNIPAKFQVELRYPGGPYSIKQRELAVGESASFDLRQIRDEQQPDRTGKALPETIDGGQFHWSIVATPGDARIVGRAEVVSRSQRVTSSYSCPVCCPDSGPKAYFNPNSYPLYVDGYAFAGANGDYWDCYFNYYTGSASWTSMWTTNTSVASVNGGTSELHGVGVGSTDVVGEYQYVYWENDGMDCYQRYDSGDNNAPVDVSGAQVGSLQYQTSSGYVTVSSTLYVLKGTSVTFKALPDPPDAQFASGKPVWSGTSGASGTGQTTSVTFNTASSSSTDYKTVTATAGNSVTANVVVLDLTPQLTPENNFSGRSLTRFGIHESITLGFGIIPLGLTASQVGGLQWQQNSGSGSLNAPSDGTGTYQAADSPESASLQLKVVNGPSKGQGPTTNITVVAPSGGSETGGDLWHVQYYWSAGFCGTINIEPHDVSFDGLPFREQNVGAQASGMLAGLAGISHCNPSCTPSVIRGSGFGGPYVDASDRVRSGAYGGPGFTYSVGNISWQIPWDYAIPGGAWHTFMTVSQAADSSNTGKARISKAGSGIFSAEAADYPSGSDCAN